MYFYLSLTALSGAFSSTNLAVLCLINESCLPSEAAGQHGLAMATIGVSFAIGPLLTALINRAFQGYANDEDGGGGACDGPGCGGVKAAMGAALALAAASVAYSKVVVEGGKFHQTVASAEGPSPEAGGYRRVNNNEEDDEDDDEDDDGDKNNNNNDGNYECDGVLSVPPPRFSFSFPNRSSLHLRSLWSGSRSLPLPRPSLETASSYLASLESPLLSTTLCVASLHYAALYSVLLTLPIYVTKAFSFASRDVSLLLFITAMSSVCGEALLVRFLVPRRGEAWCVRIGLAASSLQFAALSLSHTSYVIYLSSTLALLGGLVYPSMTSLITRLSNRSETGRNLALLNGAKSLTEGAGPLVFNLLMSVSEKTSHPGLPYLLACACSALAFKKCEGFDRLEEDEWGLESSATKGRCCGAIKRRVVKKFTNDDGNVSESNITEYKNVPVNSGVRFDSRSLAGIEMIASDEASRGSHVTSWLGLRTPPRLSREKESFPASSSSSSQQQQQQQQQQQYASSLTPRSYPTSIVSPCQDYESDPPSETDGLLSEIEDDKTEDEYWEASRNRVTSPG